MNSKRRVLTMLVALAVLVGVFSSARPSAAADSTWDVTTSVWNAQCLRNRLGKLMLQWEYTDDFSVTPGVVTTIKETLNGQVTYQGTITYSTTIVGTSGSIPGPATLYPSSLPVTYTQVQHTYDVAGHLTSESSLVIKCRGTGPAIVSLSYDKNVY